MIHLKKSTTHFLLAGPLAFGLAYAFIAAFADSPDGFLSPGVIEYSSGPLWALYQNLRMFLVFLPFAIVGAYFYTGLIFLGVGLAVGLWKRKYGKAPLWLAIIVALVMSALSGLCLHRVRWFIVFPESFESLLRFAEWSVPLLLAAGLAWLVHHRFAHRLP